MNFENPPMEKQPIEIELNRLKGVAMEKYNPKIALDRAYKTILIFLAIGSPAFAAGIENKQIDYSSPDGYEINLSPEEMAELEAQAGKNKQKIEDEMEANGWFYDPVTGDLTQRIENGNIWTPKKAFTNENGEFDNFAYARWVQNEINSRGLDLNDVNEEALKVLAENNLQ